MLCECECECCEYFVCVKRIKTMMMMKVLLCVWKGGKRDAPLVL